MKRILLILMSMIMPMLITSALAQVTYLKVYNCSVYIVNDAGNTLYLTPAYKVNGKIKVDDENDVLTIYHQNGEVFAKYYFGSDKWTSNETNDGYPAAQVIGKNTIDNEEYVITVVDYSNNKNSKDLTLFIDALNDNDNDAELIIRYKVEEY